MKYPPKEMQCKCGNTILVDRQRVWCTKCGDPLYHDPKRQQVHRYHNIYVVVAIACVLGFMTFMFVEMIAIPIITVDIPK